MQRLFADFQMSWYICFCAITFSIVLNKRKHKHKYRDIGDFSKLMESGSIVSIYLVAVVLGIGNY